MDAKETFAEQFMERNLGVLFRIGDMGYPQILRIEHSAVASSKEFLPLYEVGAINGMSMK